MCIAEFAYFRKLCLLFLKTFQSVSLWRNSLATRNIHRYPVAAAIQRNVCLVFVRELASPCVFPLEQQRRKTWILAKILLAVILVERCHEIYRRVKEGKGSFRNFGSLKRKIDIYHPRFRYMSNAHVVVTSCRTPARVSLRSRIYLDTHVIGSRVEILVAAGRRWKAKMASRKGWSCVANE